jgi:pimeloyl-ACP methyl ester carboxylesterase
MTNLVLIPGLLSDETVWRPLADAVGDRFKIHHADVRDATSIGAMAGALLDKVEGKMIVAGHSMGGRIALEMARQGRNRVDGLILADTGHHPLRAGEVVKRQEMIDLADQSMERLADRWLPPMVDPARRDDVALMGELRAMVLRADAKVHERQIRALIGRPDAGAYLAEITAPTLLLVGRHDQWSPVAQHEEMAAAVPNARVAVIDNAGHFAPVERPHAVVDAILAWIGETFGR